MKTKMIGIPEKWLNRKRMNDKLQVSMTLKGLEMVPRGDCRYRVIIEHRGTDRKFESPWENFIHD